MSNSGNENLVLGLSILLTAGVAGGGYWFFSQANKTNVSAPTASPLTSPAGTSTSAATPAIAAPNNPSNSPMQDIEVVLPNPKVITMDGSVTMVRLIKQFQVGYSQKNPTIPTIFGIPDGRPNGTNKGLKALADRQILIAANSRSLSPDEINQGIRAIPVARDALAVVIGIKNPFQGSLSMAQLKEIYQGKITNWSQVGGADAPIKVINRANASGTQSLFKSVVLLDEPFAPDSPNFITWERDETTVILQRLGDDGISYTTVSQAVGQEIIRIVPINGVMPTSLEDIRSGKYPISRVISLAVNRQISPAVKEFIDFARSPRGQELVSSSGFTPL
jgi:phosphate transport system substrate-binding protein